MKSPLFLQISNEELAIALLDDLILVSALNFNNLRFRCEYFVRFMIILLLRLEKGYVPFWFVISLIIIIINYNK